MSSADQINQELAKGISDIIGRNAQLNEDLLSNAIDSMSLVRLINLVEFLSKKHSINVSVDALISEESLSLAMIQAAFSTSLSNTKA